MRIFTLINVIITSVFFLGNTDAMAQNKDWRKIYFYFWNSNTPQTEILQKTLNRHSDSLRIICVDLIIEGDHEIDTLSCSYTNNSIYFNAIDTTYNKLSNIYLSCEVSSMKGERPFNERLTIPFLFLFCNTNRESSIAISFERKRNNYYKANVSKLNFPFIVYSTGLTSEVLNFH